MLLIGVHKIIVNKSLLNTNYMPGTVLAKTKQRTKQVKILLLWNVILAGKTAIIQDKFKISFKALDAM